MAKKEKKDQVINPDVDQNALVTEMDDLDYPQGAAPTSTTVPEAPPVPQDAVPGTPPEPVAEPPEVGKEPAPAAKVEGEPAPKVEGEPAPIAGVAVEGEPPAAAVAPVQTLEEQLVDLKKKLEDKETQASQQAHFQRLYEDAKRKLEELEAKTAPPVETRPVEEAPKPPTPEELRRYYEPEIAKVVESGYMSRAFVEDYPDDVVSMLYHRDILYNTMHRLNVVEQWATGVATRQNTSAAETHLNTLMDEVAEMGVHFQPLKDAAVRSEFRKYLDKVNPMVNQENVREVISQQYLAFNHAAVLAALGGGSPASPNPDTKPSAASGPAPAAPTPHQNLTMGEHGGTRVSQPGSTKKDPFLAEMDALDF